MVDATAMPLAAPPDLCDRLIQSARTFDAREAVEGPSLVALLPADPVHLRLRQDEPAWLVPRTGRLGRGLDGIVDRLCGGFALKFTQVHPAVLRRCQTEEHMRQTLQESEDRFLKDIRYLQKYQSCPFAVPMVPVHVLGENSQRLGYLMPELKSADKFEWPNNPLALQVFRQLLSILSFFRKSKVVYSDLKPQNLLLQEVSGGLFEVKLNDFGFVGPVGGEFQGGTDKYMPWIYQRRHKYARLGYRLDTYAVRRILVDMLGCDTVRIEVGSEVVRIQGLAGGIASLEQPAKRWILREMWRHDTVVLEVGSGVVMVLRLQWRPGPMEGPELEGLQLNALKPSERGMLEEVCCLTGRRDIAILDSKC